MNAKRVHFSIDDVEYVFSDIIKNNQKYTSIFDNRLLKFLNMLHQLYGAKFTLYGYAYFDDCCISDFPSKFKSEFQNCSDWLKLGFHWISNTYSATQNNDGVIEACKLYYDNILRFAGESTASDTIRLHYFHQSKDLPERLLTLPPFKDGMTLLCADSPNRASYNLNKSEIIQLNRQGIFYKNGVVYRSTDLRLEKIWHFGFRNYLKTKNEFIIFTHENYIFPRFSRKRSIVKSLWGGMKLLLCVKLLYHNKFEFIY